MKESKFYREDKELEADFGNKELVLDLTKKAQKEKFKRELQKGGKDKARTLRHVLWQGQQELPEVITKLP